MEFTINKDNWEKVRLSDVLTKKEENDRDNAHNRFDRFLKVEHMDAESLHIKRYSSQESGDEINPYFYKIFRKGQLLFPTRNPHLRRTALATFDGITGEKTLTLEPNQEFLHPNFIPFLFHSDSFYNHTIGAIIGSTNPHVRWRDVANFEFHLPPKAQQKQLAELLWAMDGVIEKDKQMIEELRKNDLSRLKYFFYDDKKSVRVKLKNIVKLRKGKNPSLLIESGDGIPYCTAKYLRSGEIESFVPNEYISQAILIDESDILVLWDGSNAGEMLLGKKGVLASTMCKLDIIDMEFKKEFVYAFLRFKKNDIKRATVGSAIPNVDPGMINNIGIPKLTIEQQNNVIKMLSSLNENIESLKAKLQSSQSLQKSLINQVF
jgi:restriction endonuclease S subunit